jgi:hypothetical protein
MQGRTKSLKTDKKLGVKPSFFVLKTRSTRTWVRPFYFLDGKKG